MCSDLQFSQAFQFLINWRIRYTAAPELPINLGFAVLAKLSVLANPIFERYGFWVAGAVLDVLGV